MTQKMEKLLKLSEYHSLCKKAEKQQMLKDSQEGFTWIDPLKDFVHKFKF